MNDVDKLLAIEDIKRLKARYLFCVDNKRWDELEALFADDASTDTEGNGVLRDRKTFVARVAKIFRDAVTIHRGCMPMIEVDSATTASGIWSMDDRLWFPRTNKTEPRYWEGSGYYHETYTRIEGQWRIQTFKLERVRLESFASEKEALR